MEIASQSSYEDDDEYVLLDFDGIEGAACISPNAPYTLSGLDTLHPIMIIDNKLKLIGEYEETIGTCLVFDEGKKSYSESRETQTGANPSLDKTKTSKKNTKPKQSAAKEIKPTAPVHKILKFRLFEEMTIVDSQQC